MEDSKAPNQIVFQRIYKVRNQPLVSTLRNSSLDLYEFSLDMFGIYFDIGKIIILVTLPTTDTLKGGDCLLTANRSNSRNKFPPTIAIGEKAALLE